MNAIGVATVDDIVKLLLKQRPSADASKVESHIKSTVKAIPHQQAHEKLAPVTLNKRLTRIAKAARQLDGLIYDDDPSARSARDIDRASHPSPVQLPVSIESVNLFDAACLSHAEVELISLAGPHRLFTTEIA